VWVTGKGEMTRAEKEGRVKQVPGSISLSFTGISVLCWLPGSYLPYLCY